MQRHLPNQLGANGEFCYKISMKFAVNWFHNVNLALYSNRIMPDRCLVHGCSNRSDMNAGISAHFSPRIKSERDTLLRLRLNPCGINFVARVFSPFRRRMFYKSVSHGMLSSSAYSWLNSYNTEDRARETIFQTTTPQGKPWLILSKLQCSIVPLMKFSFS